MGSTHMKFKIKSIVFSSVILLGLMGLLSRTHAVAPASSFGLWNYAPAEPGLGLYAAMRPFFLVLPDSNVRVAGAKLLAPSRDYLGISLMGINQNVIINASTTIISEGVESPLTDPYSIANGSEIDLWGMVDSRTGTIHANKVWDVTKEKTIILQLQLQIEILKQKVAELQAIIKNR